MSLAKSWYTYEEAASKFGVTTAQLQQWVERGLVRTEGKHGEVFLINGDDIVMELNMIPSL